VLAGEVDGGWRIRWRLWLLFQLTKLQAKFPLVPRLTFSERVAVKDRELDAVAAK
jgi:hypothetical protein